MSDQFQQDTATRSPAGIHAIQNWLSTPVPTNCIDELAALHQHLLTLRECHISPQQHFAVLDGLYIRGMSTVEAQLPALSGILLPLTRKTRQLVRHLQDYLRALSEDLIAILDNFDDHLIRGLRQPPDLILGRSLHTLARHLLISDLAGAPSGTDIWRLLHSTYDKALQLKLESHAPVGLSGSLHDIYFAAVLLGCAQPASFTSRESSFVAQYLNLFAGQVDARDSAYRETANAPFWIDLTRDAPATARARKPAPPETRIIGFSCKHLVARLKVQLAALDNGITPQQLQLPDYAASPAGQGILRRLISAWGDPGKRRFPRRRQNYRATLCTGLSNLWQLFQHKDSTTIDASCWMIINESPDGYAIMHVSGKTGSLAVGEIAALQTESSADWKICIIRWAVSENQEHLELGLQILATRATPALLALSAQTNDTENRSVLILPEIPALRETEMLVTRTGSLPTQKTHFVLIVESETLAIREAKNTGIEEQNSCIEVFSIQPDPLNL